MSQQVKKINDMFDNIESKISGGSNDTQPYNTFKTSLNRIYDYFSVIFVSNKENNEKYQTSVDNLDKPCDCSKYKCKEGNSEENDEIDNDDDYDEENDQENDQENDEENDQETQKTQEFEEPEETEEKKESKLLLKTSKIL
jgi:hypothetical protein